MSKDITVRLTIDWTFTEKEWSNEQKHILAMKEEPRIVFGYDLLSSIHNLNSISHPDLKYVKVSD